MRAKALEKVGETRKTEVILKFKPKVFGKYLVILGVVRYDFISTYIALCNL